MWRAGRIAVPTMAIWAAAMGPGGARAEAAGRDAVESALSGWIGTAEAGWTPVAFGALRAAMSPAEVGRHFPGAEKVIGGRASKVRLSGIAHVQEVQFAFMKSRPDGQKGLAQAIVTLERGFFEDQARFQSLVRVLEAKFGPMRPGPNSMTKGFWMVRTGGERRTAQLIDWGRGQDLQLSFDFAAGGPAPAAAAARPPAASSSIFHSASCRAVEAIGDTVIVEAKADGRSACNAALKEKLRAARCRPGATSVTYRLQQWGVGRWSNGVRLRLACQ